MLDPGLSDMCVTMGYMTTIEPYKTGINLASNTCLM